MVVAVRCFDGTLCDGDPNVDDGNRTGAKASAIGQRPVTAMIATRILALVRIIIPVYDVAPAKKGLNNFDKWIYIEDIYTGIWFCENGIVPAKMKACVKMTLRDVCILMTLLQRCIRESSVTIFLKSRDSLYDNNLLVQNAPIMRYNLQLSVCIISDSSFVTLKMQREKCCERVLHQT